ncbi:hypothetical protein CRV24_005628 [Beauveria bassiana]|nr:hypothetical protein CRV24_005628 [Beauveria bassiana]
MICCLIPCRQSCGLGFLVPRRGKHRSGLARRRRKQTVCEPSAGGTHKGGCEPDGQDNNRGAPICGQALASASVRVGGCIAASRTPTPGHPKGAIRVGSLQRAKAARCGRWGRKDCKHSIVDLAGCESAGYLALLALDLDRGFYAVGWLPMTNCANGRRRRSKGRGGAISWWISGNATWCYGAQDFLAAYVYIYVICGSKDSKDVRQGSRSFLSIPKLYSAYRGVFVVSPPEARICWPCAGPICRESFFMAAEHCSELSVLAIRGFRIPLTRFGEFVRIFNHVVQHVLHMARPSCNPVG